MRKWLLISLVMLSGMSQAADLKTLLEAAQATHPDLRSAQAAIEAAQRKRDAASAAFRPQVRLSLEQDYAWMKADFARSSVNLTGSWTLWQPQADARIKLADELIRVEQAREQAVRQQLLWQVVQAWVRWQKLQAAQRFEQARQQVLDQLLVQMRQSYGAGRGQLARVALLSRRKAESSARLEALRAEADAVRAEIRALTGRDDLSERAPAPLPSVKQAMNVSSHPALAALEASAAALAQQRLAEQGRYKGRLNVFATGVRNDSGGRFYDDMEGVRVGIRYEVPLITGGAIEADVAARAAQQRQVRMEAESLRRRLTQLWQQAQARIRQAHPREQALKAALEASRLDEAANLALLRSGEVSVLTVLESALACYRIDRDLAFNRWDAWRARWQQDYAEGKISPQLSEK